MIWLNNGDKIALPKYINADERVIFSSKLIEQFPNSFTFTNIPEIDKLVSIRLDILGTYILQGDKEKGNSVMSRYKIKSRKKSEIPFSNINENLDISMNIDVNHQIM